MYHPTFITNRNGVPILHKSEIDIIGECFIRDFQPKVLSKPEPVDIEAFVEYYLGMATDFQFLSHNGIYLGMTVFNDTDKIPVWCPETNRAEYVSARARTIIIDNRLLEKNQHHRYRFTVGHEGSHDIFHTGVYASNPYQTSIFDSEQMPVIQCRLDSGRGRGDPRYWNDKDRMEWQADRLSSALLMPASAVRLVAERYGSTRSPIRNAKVINDMVEIFDVSTEAVVYRLKDLGLIPQELNPRTLFDFLDVIIDEDDEELCLI